MFEDIIPWICGNAVVEPYVFEECDDGNTVDGDGCTFDCLLENPGLAGITGYIGGEESGTLGDEVSIMAFEQFEENPGAPASLPTAVQTYPADFPFTYYLYPPVGTHFVAAYIEAGIDGQPIIAHYLVDDVPAPVVVEEGSLASGVKIYFAELATPEPGTVSGSATFAGEVTADDSLLVFVSDAPLPGNLLTAEKLEVKPVIFPYYYTVSNVPPGEYWVTAVFDTGDNALWKGLSDGDEVGVYPSAADYQSILVGEGQDVVGIHIDLGP